MGLVDGSRVGRKWVARGSRVGRGWDAGGSRVNFQMFLKLGKIEHSKLFNNCREK